MIQSPIHKVLLTFRNCNVRYLLIGGQACIVYGGAEFSRDVDLSVAIDTDNLKAIKNALTVLNAETVFVPSLGKNVLKRGHACHFSCHTKGAEGLRIDIINKMRGCPVFKEIWKRRNVVKLPEIGEVSIISLQDLVQSKKTQREKDWPMIRRLIETDISQGYEEADKNRISFWFRECRTPVLIKELAQNYPDVLKEMIHVRPLLKHAVDKDINMLEIDLKEEENREKEADYEYWQPLRKELEQWRHKRGS